MVSSVMFSTKKSIISLKKYKTYISEVIETEKQKSTGPGTYFKSGKPVSDKVDKIDFSGYYHKGITKSNREQLVWLNDV